MNLVDSCGWIEYFTDSPHADFYAAAIENLPFADSIIYATGIISGAQIVTHDRHFQHLEAVRFLDIS